MADALQIARALLSQITSQRGRVPLSAGPLTYTDDGTNRVVTNSYADNDKLVIGREYLSALHKKVIAGTAINLVTSGDSTTSGNSSTGPYHIETLIKTMYDKDSFTGGMTPINRGQSGQATFHWAATHVNGDIAANPDLLILRWGINEPGWNKDGTGATAGAAGDAARRDINDFKTALRAGLTTLRASKPLATTSVILMTPNSTNDTPNRRDTLWYEQVTNVVRQAARDFQCCFIDTYAFLQDSVSAADWMDNPYGDGRHIHPNDVMNLWIAGLIYDTAFPIGVRMKLGNGNGSGITNVGGLTLQKLVTDAPSTYPKGVSIYRTNSTFPYDGVVTTMYHTDEVLLQINVPYKDGDKNFFAMRIGFNGLPGAATVGWKNWVYPGDSQNVNSSKVIKSAADAPSTYPQGVSMHRAMGTFPYNGAVTTFYQSDEILMQIHTGYDTNNTAMAFRLGYKTTDIWSSWIYLRPPLQASIGMTLLNSWTNYSGIHRLPAYYQDQNSGMVYLEGLIKGGTFTSGTTICTLPVGYRPSKDIYFPVANGAYGEITVTSAGNVNITIAANNTYLSLDGIRFPAR